jgi:chemotaxis signal transduction protein
MIQTVDPAPTVEIVLFEIKGVNYAADASQVVRIDRAAPDANTESGERALMVLAADGACRPIRVDAVHGLRTVPVTSLRRLPFAIDTKEVAVGVWLDGETPVILLDLLQLLTGPGGP